MSRNQKLTTLGNKASVTGMVMTSDKLRLVTAGLDKSVSIWSIIRKNGVYISLYRLLMEQLTKGLSKMMS